MWFASFFSISTFIVICCAAEFPTNLPENYARNSGSASGKSDIVGIAIRSSTVRVNSTETARIEKCSYNTDPETTFSFETEKENCCRDIAKSFRSHWGRVVVQLSDLLRLLKRLNCSEFEEQCQWRTYAFSEFNKLTYDRFCGEHVFTNQCAAELGGIMLKYENSPNQGRIFRYKNSTDAQQTSIKSQSFRKKLLQLAEQKLTLNDMLRPCVQVALIDVDNRPKNGYFEMKELQVPMCQIVWCGFPGSAYERYEISEWSCTPSRCRANVVILMVTCGILAFVSTLVNVLAVAVFAKNRRLRDSQGIYKISLAVADLLIGIFVFTTAIETMRRAYMPRVQLLSPEESGKAWPTIKIHSFNNSYHGFVGFFTTLSNSVSVYTLMVAGIDRFMVVFRPLRYNVYTAKSWATKFVIAVWVLCAIFSILPILLPGMRYETIAGFLESMTGDAEFIILSFAFAIPIFFVVMIHIATFVYSKQNAKARPKHIPPGVKVREISVENRLARTLLIMVTAFLACLLPLAIVIVLHLFSHDSHTHFDTISEDSIILFNSLELVFCIVFISNSLWNFFIYNARSAEFRGACKKVFAGTKLTLKSKLFRDSAKEARQRRTSAAISNSSQVHCNTASTANTTTGNG